MRAQSNGAPGYEMHRNLDTPTFNQRLTKIRSREKDRSRRILMLYRRSLERIAGSVQAGGSLGTGGNGNHPARPVSLAA